MQEQIRSVIAGLEKQKVAIDKAIAILSEVDAPPVAESPREPLATVSAVPAKKTRNMSAAGRKRIADASKKRWAKVRREKLKHAA